MTRSALTDGERRVRRLLLLCSRIEMTAWQEGAASELLGAKIDTGGLIDLAIRHKVLQLAGPHLIRLAPRGSLAFGMKRLIEFYCHGHAQRNRELFAQAALALEAFGAAGVTAVPLKGLVLGPEVYPDPGRRTLNDLDFLIGRNQRRAASRALVDIGYVVGDLDPWTGTLEPASRETELTWHMYLGNLHPHVRILDDPFAQCSRIDLSYDATGSADSHLTEALLDATVEGSCCGVPCRRLTSTDFLLHIAVHLHKEGTNERWLAAGSEQNLIKFCDLREYALRLGDEVDWSAVVERSREIGADRALYYGIARLRALFADPFAETILSCFGSSGGADDRQTSFGAEVDAGDAALGDWIVDCDRDLARP